MKRPGLYLLVEGDDDERFWERVLKPRLETRYSWVACYRYACATTTKLAQLLKSVEAMGAEYIFAADFDAAKCIADRKCKIRERLNCIDESKVLVVEKEIESWYLAGLTSRNAQQRRMPDIPSTNEVTKEKFASLIPKRYGSRIIFMLDLLGDYSVDLARRKNRSFAYIMQKYELTP